MYVRYVFFRFVSFINCFLDIVEVVFCWKVQNQVRMEETSRLKIRICRDPIIMWRPMLWRHQSILRCRSLTQDPINHPRNVRYHLRVRRHRMKQLRWPAWRIVIHTSVEFWTENLTQLNQDWDRIITTFLRERKTVILLALCRTRYFDIPSRHNLTSLTTVRFWMRIDEIWI